MNKFLVVGHADADGHVIAEQTRRNLSLISEIRVPVVVDPLRTQGHKSWAHLDRLHEIEEADTVVFVDLMFGPMTYAAESDSLVSFAKNHPKKKFLLIDHHPLPERRLAAAENLHSIYRPDVFDCTLGPRSGLMVIAALCENQRDEVASVVQPHHYELAKGMRRAAAHGSGLPGEKLMTLLAWERWDAIYSLAEDDAANHRLVRGRRPAAYLPSEIMRDAETIAAQIVKPGLNANVETLAASDSRRNNMPFDIDGERYVRDEVSDNLTNAPVQTRDLERLSTLLEVAALSLTDAPGATFTLDELLREARSIAGSDVEIEDRDFRTVCEKVTFLEGARGEGMRLK